LPRREVWWRYRAPPGSRQRWRHRRPGRRCYARAPPEPAPPAISGWCHRTGSGRASHRRRRGRGYARNPGCSESRPEYYYKPRRAPKGTSHRGEGDFACFTDPGGAVAGARGRPAQEGCLKCSLSAALRIAATQAGHATIHHDHGGGIALGAALWAFWVVAVRYGVLLFRDRFDVCSLLLDQFLLLFIPFRSRQQHDNDEVLFDYISKFGDVRGHALATGL